MSRLDSGDWIDEINNGLNGEDNYHSKQFRVHRVYDSMEEDLTIHCSYRSYQQ